MLGIEFQLPLDDAGFSLRRCPSCDSEFKVRGTRRDGRVLAGALADRLPHMNRGEIGVSLVLRHCPYCGARHPAEAWWTSDQLAWLEAQARRLRDEIRWRWMQLPFDRLGQNPRPTYVSVPPSRTATPSPEEARQQLVSIPLPCCGEELQVGDGWVVPIRCHYCGLVHARSAIRDFGLELAQLRAWAVRVRSP